MDADVISRGIAPGTLGWKVVVFESTASTNDVAAEYARNSSNHGLVVLADLQTKGRGRGGHRWLAGKGDSLLCSTVLTRCTFRPEQLSQTVALAVAEVVGPKARIKWPNDVLLSGKKVAGILVESKAYDGYTAYVVGIGINCHQRAEDFPVEFRSTAISLDLATGTVVDRNVLARRLLTCMEYWLTVAREEATLISKAWAGLCIQAGLQVAAAHKDQG